ncbi:MAG: c-type cytochrome [Chloroflexi bacterium]|nr:c-type cytochrome [Chloroflexota bacterium]
MMRRAGERRGRVRTLVVSVAALLVLAGLSAGAALAMPALQNAQAGAAVFTSKCAACHTIGGGSLIGPDLKGITSQRSHEWLTAWISAPDRLIAQGDPTALEIVKQYPIPMPNLGLSPTEVASVLAYIEAQSASGAAAAPAAPPPLPAGDPILGKDYFTGSLRFQNGGPPCMGCHSVAGIGALGGGTLGPDLTPAISKYGEAGLASFLANPPTPTMNAVWSGEPLTPEEQGSLRLFLQEAGVAQRSTEALGQLTALAVVVGLVMLGLMQVTWRRRLPGVRRPMLRRTV